METPKTVLFNLEGVFEDFSTRRTALIRALTTDQDEFYGFCNSEAEILCLYGHDDGSWEVKPPEPTVPTMLPEPMTGINLYRNDVSRVDWLSTVAIHSDAWLMSVSFFLGALLTADERMSLFTMINERPTIYEIFTRFNTRGNQEENRQASGMFAHNADDSHAHVEGAGPSNEMPTQQRRRVGSKPKYAGLFRTLEEPAP